MSELDAESIIRLCKENVLFLNPDAGYSIDQLQCVTWYKRSEDLGNPSKAHAAIVYISAGGRWIFDKYRRSVNTRVLAVGCGKPAVSGKPVSMGSSTMFSTGISKGAGLKVGPGKALGSASKNSITNATHDRTARINALYNMLVNLERRVESFADTFAEKLGHDIEFHDFSTEARDEATERLPETFMHEGRLFTKSEFIGNIEAAKKQGQAGENGGRQNTENVIGDSTAGDGVESLQIEHDADDDESMTELESQDEDFHHVENDF